MPCVADQLLIEEVRLHECLYAITTKSNRDNQQRDQAWNDIAKTLGKSVEELKERWRYMRDRYVKEIGGRKYQGHVPTIDCKIEGSFVNLMSFLNPFIKRKTCPNGRPTPTDASSKSQEMREDMFDLEMCAERATESAESDGCIEFVNVTDDVTSVMSPTVSITCRPGPVRLRPIVKKERDCGERKRSANGSGSDHHNGTIASSSLSGEYLDASPLMVGAEKRQRVSDLEGTSTRDSTDLFCATIAGMLRELPAFQRERIKRDIYNLVSDALLVEMAS